MQVGAHCPLYAYFTEFEQKHTFTKIKLALEILSLYDTSRSRRPPFSAGVKKAWHCTPTFPNAFVAWSSANNRDNFISISTTHLIHKNGSLFAIHSQVEI
jgi:hypothetical protein